MSTYIKSAKIILIVGLVFNVIVLAFYQFGGPGKDSYSGNAGNPPVFTASGISQQDAKNAARIATSVYQNGWYHLIHNEQMTDLSDLGPVEDTASISDFPVFEQVNRRIVKSDSLVGPKLIVDAVYVAKNKSGDYVATACEFQKHGDMRLITDTGNADTLDGVSGWRVTIKDADGDAKLKEVVKNSSTCNKIEGLVKK